MPASDVETVLLEHARRGLGLQLVLRGALVAFLVAVLLALPPARPVTYGVLVAVDAVSALVTALRVRRGGRAAVRTAWLAQYVDLAVLTALVLLAGRPAADVLTWGFLLVPLMGATQLRPRVTAAVVVPAVLLPLLAGLVVRGPEAELLLHALVAAGVGLGCVGLSRIQRSRVRTIARLLADRTELLAELTDLERRERRALSEDLHDGALQYVLAARQDLDDVRDAAARQDPDAVDRLDEALRESSRLLRSTVAELNPAVLDRAGLRAALGELVRSAAARGGFDAEVDAGSWPDDLRTPVDALLYRAARELLGNVVAHARAGEVRVRLALVDGEALLVVDDDGTGVPDGAIGRGLERGHIGLASHRMRIEAAGGRLAVAPRAPRGTRAVVALPAGTPGT